MTRRIVAAAALLAAMPVAARAHSGPPFPILSDHRVASYLLSIWTDPDATDDGSARGQFWVRLSAGSRQIPEGTRVTVAIRPLDRSRPELTAQALPVRGDRTNQFAALVMDHEGPFAVRVQVAGPLGTALAEAETNATYDLRPAPWLVVLYVLPFALAGVLWGTLIVRRRRVERQRPARR